MSDNTIYSCTREMLEDKADKAQVGPAPHAMFPQSYTSCITDDCFFLPKVVVLLQVTLLTEAYWEFLSSLLRC